MQPRTFYRPELDTLRFLAFMLVFMFHVCASLQPQMAAAGGSTAFIAQLAMAGAWGVDLFFLLSAYLITTLLLDPIALGIIVAVGFRRLPQLSSPARTALAAAGVGCMLVGSLAFQATANGPLSTTDGLLGFPFGAAGALLLFLSILGADLRIRWTEYLGRISYGLYVFHLFALEVAKTVLLHRFGTCPWWARGLLALPVTVAMAAISYRWLEAPFLRLKGATKPAAQSLVSSLS